MGYATLDKKIRGHFSVRNEALLLCEMTRMNTGAWQEISRGFVVCATWPRIEPGVKHPSQP